MMLQTKQISKVLSQGLNPISKELSTNGVNEPLSLSLLSHSGLPLTTVSNHSVEQESLTVDNLKIYSLLAMSHLKNQITQKRMKRKMVTIQGKMSQIGPEWQSIRTCI